MRSVQLVTSKLAYAASQGVILLALARLGGAAMAGTYALLIAVISPVFLFTNLRVQDLVSTGRSGRPVGDYIRATRTSNALGVLACLVVAVVALRSDALLAVIGLAIAKYFEALSRGAYGHAQHEGQYGRAILSNLGHAIFPAAALVAGLLWTERLGPALLLMALPWMLQYLLWERTFFARMPVGREWSLSTDWCLLASLVPLGASAMLLSLNQSIVRVALSSLTSVAVLGVFASVAYTVRLGAVIARGAAELHVRAMGRAADLPELRRAAARPLVATALTGLVLGALMVALGPWAWPLVFGPEFRPDRGLLAMVALAGMFVYATTGVSLAVVASGRHTGQLMASLAGVIVTAMLIVPLITAWGAIGAATAWAVGEGVRFAMMLRQLADDTEGNS